MMGRKRKTGLDLPQRVYLNHGQYFFVDRSNKWHPLGKDYYLAMIKYAELNANPLPCSNMGTMMDRYQTEIIPTKAIRTQKGNLEEIKRLRKVFGHMKPEEIEPQEIYQYMDARKAPIRANREVALLSNIFTKAIRWGYCKDNPCKLVQRNPEKPRDRYVTDTEFWQTYDLASNVIQVAMMITSITGLRQTDILNLQLPQFTEEGLEVKTSKTGKRLIFEWTPELKAVYKAAIELRKDADISSTYFLSNRKGQPYTPSGFKAMWRRVMLRAKDNGVEWFQFRDLRAKAGSDHKDGTLLGNSARIRERHYRRKPQEVTPIPLKRTTKE